MTKSKMTRTRKNKNKSKKDKKRQRRREEAFSAEMNEKNRLMVTIREELENTKDLALGDFPKYIERFGDPKDLGRLAVVLKIFEERCEEEKRKRSEIATRHIMEILSKPNPYPGWQPTGGFFKGTALYDPNALKESIDSGTVPLPIAVCPGSVTCCNRKECRKEESQENGGTKFKRCSKCFTRYCSLECQREDWNNHKSFCKSSRAFDSRLEHWESHIPTQLVRRNITHDQQDIYMKMLTDWLDSQEIIELINHTGVNKEQILSEKLKERECLLARQSTARNSKS